MSEAARQIEPLLDAEEAARILGMSEDWVYEHAAAGDLPSYKIGGRRKFRASELEAFIQSFAEGKMGTVTPFPDRRR